MKRIGFMLIGSLIGSLAFAGTADARNVYIAGHYLANGRYVPPHYEQVPDAVYPGYQGVDPDGNTVAPVYPYGAPYAPYQAAPYQAAPYVPGAGYAPGAGYVPGYGYVPR